MDAKNNYAFCIYCEDEYAIYLTNDNGTCPYCTEILDILHNTIHKHIVFACYDSSDKLEFHIFQVIPGMEDRKTKIILEKNGEYFTYHFFLSYSFPKSLVNLYDENEIYMEISLHGT